MTSHQGSRTSSGRERLRRSIITVSAIGAALALGACSSTAAPGVSTGGGSVAGGNVPAAAPADPDLAPRIAAVSTVAPADPTAGLRTVTATGMGTATVAPDILIVTLGVQHQDSTASAALERANTDATAVIEQLKAAGVQEKDLQTSDLSVQPTTDDDGKITGYQVTNMVTATLRDLSKAGATLDAVGQAAGNSVRVQGLVFSLADPTAAQAQARADAVKQAAAQAQQMADAAGVALGPVRSIQESSSGRPPEMPMAVADSAERAAVPIEAGSLDVRISVQLVYDLG